MPRKPITITLAIAAVAAIGWVGNMDYQDEVAYQQHECDMIEAGHWPEEVNPHCGKESAE